MTDLITHEVRINGEVLCTTKLPVGIDTDAYDADCAALDEATEAETSAGEKGAVQSLRIAARVGKATGKSWKQIVQDDAYADVVTAIYARHGKSKGAYSQKRTEIRENPERLSQVLADIATDADDLKQMLEKWTLDPDRPKNGGGPKKKILQGESPSQVVVDEDPDEDDEANADVGNATLAGIVGACTTRLRRISASDVTPDTMNQLRELIHAAEGAKSFVVAADAIG